MTLNQNWAVLAVISLMLAFVLSSVPAYAQEEAAEEYMEEVVTIGTRGKPRSTTDSTAPVDVISGDDFVSQGGVDTANLLRNVVPSFNVNDQPISDAATLVRPANLRGLAPDHTLVLVNGQRRHRAAVITWLGNGLSDGSQGPDIAAIPSIALRSVEVLRDGAAAQYGSDAIAGVINFNLKNSNSEGSFEARYGEYSEGDGELMTFAVNKGFALFNEVYCKIIELLKIVRGKKQLAFKIKAEPLDVFLDRLDVLGLLFERVGVVEAQVALAAVGLGQAEVETDALGVPDVQVAVGLRRKARVDAAAVFAVLQIGVDDLADEVGWRGGTLGRGGIGFVAHDLAIARRSPPVASRKPPDAPWRGCAIVRR